MALLMLNNLNKSFDAPAVADISLALERGHILCLLGPSGCGKTTLLRLIAGLEQPDNGSVFFDGMEVTEKPAHRRKFGMMFQDFALFPHKDVFDNVAFGLQMLKLEKDLVDQRTVEMLALTGLEALSRRNVADLSGGEKQRVALARSLAPHPKLLMLDEPMGSLDRALREKLLVDIRSILKQLGMTAIFVTHDQSEAFGLADHIAVMNNGRIVQVDTPENLYRHPENIFVAKFLGFSNMLKGTVATKDRVETGVGVFTIPSGEYRRGDSVTLLLRPEGARLKNSPVKGPEPGIIKGSMTNRIFIGQRYRIRVNLNDTVELVFDLPNHEPPPLTGEPITLQINPNSISIL